MGFSKFKLIRVALIAILAVYLFNVNTASLLTNNRVVEAASIVLNPPIIPPGGLFGR